ncbi:MAG: ribonuclease [Sphingomonadaceae bacterium]|nr:MAG: ribonuclease [Sphingomonadaceae bacterium]
MADWFAEHTVTETRGLLLDRDEVLAARFIPHGELASGMRVTARLTHKKTGASRGVAVDTQGNEILIDRIPSGVTEGQEISIEIFRAAMHEFARTKLAQGRVVQANYPSEEPGQSIFTALPIRDPRDDLWSEILHSAASNTVDFAGGTLHFSPTPAMTLIDIDGAMSPRELALAAVPQIARWVRLFDIGGSIGIDFPTLAAKADRRAVDDALAEALVDWPHERTSMNGFGFVQIVARLEGPSLLHRFANARAEMAARIVLHQASRISEPGAIQLSLHPAARANIRPSWLDALAARTGREIRFETDPALALESGFAQAVPR